jgi:hypothetical protein
MKINNYNNFLILEKYDKNIRAKLIELGVTDKDELERQVKLSKEGHLGAYLHSKGDKFWYVTSNIFRCNCGKKKN